MNRYKNALVFSVNNENGMEHDSECLVFRKSTNKQWSIKRIERTRLIFRRFCEPWELLSILMDVGMRYVCRMYVEW